MLTLDLQYRAEDSWTNCFTVTAPDTNIAIPSVAYLGFSGETGELADNHDIISVKAHNLYNTGGTTGNRGSSGSGSSAKGAGSVKPPSEKGGWGWFLFKTILFFAAIAGAYVGWTMYRTRQQYSRF